MTDRMTAVAKLPEKWRQMHESTPGDAFSQGIGQTLAMCADELTAALSPAELGGVDYRKVIERIKLRIHFINWPGESMWNAGNAEAPRWIPDWRYEIALVENALHGSPITAAEKPTDTKRRIEVSTPRAAEAEWLPIESAPKDGSYVLVANQHGAWIAKWHPVYQSGYMPHNSWASMMLNHDHIERPGRFDKPTHWRALTPPKENSDG